MRPNFKIAGVTLLAIAAAVFVLLLARPGWHAAGQPDQQIIDASKTSQHNLTIDLKAIDPALQPLAVRAVGYSERSEPGALRHRWPAFYAEARFRGDRVILRLDDPVNRYRVAVDGRKSSVISRVGRKDVVISGFGEGEHTIRVDKISETGSTVAFLGFYVRRQADALPPPAAARKFIEFIGDSDTVGFGNLSNSRDCPEGVFANTDTSAGYGPSVAARFTADYRLIARSGIGLIRNYLGTEEPVMRDVLSSARDADTSRERADVIVLALGSNDFSGEFRANEPWHKLQDLRKDFEPALISLARQRLDDNPGAVLILLAFGEYGEELVESYEAANSQLAARGYRTKLIVLPELARNGCRWHPSLKDHALISSLLAEGIDQAVPEWMN